MTFGIFIWERIVNSSWLIEWFVWTEFLELNPIRECGKILSKTEGLRYDHVPKFICSNKKFIESFECDLPFIGEIAMEWNRSRIEIDLNHLEINAVRKVGFSELGAET